MTGFGQSAFGGSGSVAAPLFAASTPLWGATIPNSQVIQITLSIPGGLASLSLSVERAAAREDVYTQGLGAGTGYTVTITGTDPNYLISVTHTAPWPDATLTLNMQAVDQQGNVTNQVAAFTVTSPQTSGIPAERLNRGLN